MLPIRFKTSYGKTPPKQLTLPQFQSKLKQIFWIWGWVTLNESVRRLESSRTKYGTPMAPLSRMWANYKEFMGLKPNIGQATGRMLRHLKNPKNVQISIGGARGSTVAVLRGHDPRMSAQIDGFERGFSTEVKSIKQQRFLEYMLDVDKYPYGLGPVGVGTELRHPPRPFFGRDAQLDKRAADQVVQLVLTGKLPWEGV